MQDETFGKVKMGVSSGGEVWGENEHGCFSLISGQFIPNEEGGKGRAIYMGFKPPISVVFPCDKDDDYDGKGGY